MMGAVCRVFQVDASLNGARYGRLARDLLNTGYSPLEIELWFSPEDRLDTIRHFYGDEAVDAIENHSWYYCRHWAWLSQASAPNEVLLRQSVQHAKIGKVYEIWGDKGESKSDSEVLTIEEMKAYIKSMKEGA